MQDEVNTKVVAIAIKGGRITAEVLKKALAKFIEEIEKAEKQASQPKTYRGKQSIKHLVEQNAAISNIEVTDGNIKSFERTANKYGIDYALKKDTAAGSSLKPSTRRRSRLRRRIGALSYEKETRHQKARPSQSPVCVRLLLCG